MKVCPLCSGQLWHNTGSDDYICVNHEKGEEWDLMGNKGCFFRATKVLERQKYVSNEYELADGTMARMFKGSDNQYYVEIREELYDQDVLIRAYEKDADIYQLVDGTFFKGDDNDLGRIYERMLTSTAGGHDLLPDLFRWIWKKLRRIWV